ncbi:MAG: hypothetical protein HRU03_01650 [Nanoarchaeales archaeon]|nr:hypothetical protein [Nanoarchaeales archaeon]
MGYEKILSEYEILNIEFPFIINSIITLDFLIMSLPAIMTLLAFIKILKILSKLSKAKRDMNIKKVEILNIDLKYIGKGYLIGLFGYSLVSSLIYFGA